MRALRILLCLLPLLPTTTLANDMFTDVKVKVGKKTCTCSFSMDPAASVKDSKGSCDKKCSGLASGVVLAGEDIVFTVDFLVKRGKLAFKSIKIQRPPTTTPPTGPPNSGPGSVTFSCPPGFRSVCSMLGSCSLGTYSMCPPGHQESGAARKPFPSDCRCVPFFLLEQLYESTTGSKGPQTSPDESRSILARESVQNQEQFEEDVEATVKVGKRTCSCRFTIIIIVIREEGVIIVIVQVSAKSRASCDKKCSGAAKNVEITGQSGITYRFGLSVKKGKARMSHITSELGQFPTRPTGETPVSMETPISTQPPTLTSLPPTGCLCVDKDDGPSTMGQLTFNETGHTYVQEQIFSEETGILEIHVPPHKNYTDSVYLVSEEGVLLHTNFSCQLSEVPQNMSQGGLGLPLPRDVPQSSQESSYYVAKVRQTRVTARQRKALRAEHRIECRERSITMTKDLPVSAEDFQKLTEGGIVQVNKTISTRGCREAYQCSKSGPDACGWGWVNPAGGGFTFHDVSTGTVCVTCKLNVNGAQDLCDPGLCWCHNITNKVQLLDCAFISNPTTTTMNPTTTAFNGRGLLLSDDGAGTRNTRYPGVELGIVDSEGDVFTQTMTYSGPQYDARSLTVEVPQHQGGETAFDQLTVVMHAQSKVTTFNYWHLKDNLLYKRGNHCSITDIPRGFYPVDGALGMREIVDVLEEEDSLVQHSVLLDEGEMNDEGFLGLHPQIQDMCEAASSTRRVKEEKVTAVQVQTLQDGGVVLLPQASTRGCPVWTALTYDKYGANCWYWPNPSTGADVALHYVIHGVEQLSCCENTSGAPGACCTTQHPDLCLCEDIVTPQDFLDCLEGPEDDTEVLLVATGSPNATHYTSKRVQFYEKDLVTGTYAYRESSVCNYELQGSSLSVGTVVANVSEETVLLCDGYTGSDITECYRFTEGEGFQAFGIRGEVRSSKAAPDLSNGGHSVMTTLVRSADESPFLAWLIFPNQRGGTTDAFYITLDGAQHPMPYSPVPIALSITCVLATEFGIFISGIPSSSPSTGNKNWLYHGYDLSTWGTWTELPESREKRLGGSCGSLRSRSTTTGTDNSTIIVMAGGLRISSSEYLRLPDGAVEEPVTSGDFSQTWKEGPDIGEARYGSRMASMKTENEVVLVGGIAADEVLPTFKVLNSSLDAWHDLGEMWFPVFDTVALAVPKRILRGCDLTPPDA